MLVRYAEPPRPAAPAQAPRSFSKRADQDTSSDGLLRGHLSAGGVVAQESEAAFESGGFQGVFRIPGRVSVATNEGAKSFRMSTAAIAPDLTWHVAGLAKCLGAGLRIAYVVVPDVRSGWAFAASFMPAAPAGQNQLIGYPDKASANYSRNSKPEGKFPGKVFAPVPPSAHCKPSVVSPAILKSHLSPAI